MCAEDFGDQVVDRLWSFEIGQVTDTRKYVMSGTANCTRHEGAYGNTRLVVLTDHQQNWHL
jgi:hypothetical protein